MGSLNFSFALLTENFLSAFGKEQLNFIIGINILSSHDPNSLCHFFNRPGVAGAILQSPPSLIH